jgi:hypothetical protein
MKRWLVALVFVAGCGSKASPASSTPQQTAAPAAAAPVELPPRAQEDLSQQVADFAGESATPGARDAGFVVPPRENELDWINDSAAPLDQRVQRAMGLFDDSTTVMKRYSTHSSTDSAEALSWSEAVIRVFGRIATAMVDEFLPTVSESDPKYAARMEGMAKMRDGAFAMLQASIDTLKARRSPLEARRGLAAVWRLYAPRYAALWPPHRCAQLAGWLTETLEREDDPALRGDLEALRTALGSCRGR